MKISENKVRKIIREELMALMEQEKADGKSPSLDDLEFVSSERAEYERWVSRHGHTSSEVQSVLADYLVDQKLQDDHDLHKKLTKELGFEHSSLMADLESRLPKDTDPASEEDVRELELAQVVEAISKL